MLRKPFLPSRLLEVVEELLQPQISQFDITIPRSGARCAKPSSVIRRSVQCTRYPRAHQPQVCRGELGLAADGDAADPLAGRRRRQRVEQPVERRRIARHQLEHPELVLGPAGRERRRVPQRERDQLAAFADQRRVADAELAGQGDLAGEVHAREERRRSAPALRDAPLRGRARRREQLGCRRPPGGARRAPGSPSGGRAPGRSGCRTRCCPPCGASSPGRWWSRPGCGASRCRSAPSASRVPSPWRSGRTASGPIQPSVPERCTMLNATMWPSASRQTMAPSPASSIA